MKNFLIEYETSGRDYKKIVEVPDGTDMETYIKENFQIEASVLKKLNKKLFYRAIEIAKNPVDNSWHYVKNGEYWFCRCENLFDRLLVKSEKGLQRDGKIDRI